MSYYIMKSSRKISPYPYCYYEKLFTFASEPCQITAINRIIMSWARSAAFIRYVKNGERCVRKHAGREHMLCNTTWGQDRLSHTQAKSSRAEKYWTVKSAFPAAPWHYRHFTSGSFVRLRHTCNRELNLLACQCLHFLTSCQNFSTRCQRS